MRFSAPALALGALLLVVPVTVSPQAYYAPLIEVVQAQRVQKHLPLVLHRKLPDAEKLSKWIVEYANLNGLDPLLVVSVIVVESHFDPQAISPAGAIGLMQILPSTGKAVAFEAGIVWQGLGSLFDPRVNIQLGTLYLAELVVMFNGNLEHALAAYNQGPTRVRERLKQGKKIHNSYTHKVKKYHRQFFNLEIPD